MSFSSLVSWPNRHVEPGTIPALEIIDAKAEEGEHKQMVVMVTQLTIKAKHLPVLVLAELVDERQKKLARETRMASQHRPARERSRIAPRENTMPSTRQ
jgi:hypothetical protein